MLSPGIAQGCFEFLRVVSQSNIEETAVASCFPSFGAIPGDAIFRVAKKLRWARIDEHRQVKVSDTGRRILELTSYPLRLRQALRDLVELDRPPWIQNAISGRSRVLAYAGNEIAQTIIEAELAAKDGPDEVEFWDFLASIARGERDSRLLRIGREGERLTIEYERSRTGCDPKWVAVESNEDGYDVLSVVSDTQSQALAIEVKSSTIGQSGSAILSRNEWDQSGEFANYCFHFWDLESEKVPRLAIVSREELSLHVPADRGEGSWSVLRIPFRTFQSSFVSP